MTVAGGTDRADVDVVLFDLDGTLTDSSGDFLLAIRHALGEVGVEPPDEATLRTYIGPPLLETVVALGVRADAVEAVVDAYRERYRANRSAATVVHDGIPDVLVSLRDRGVRIGVATSKPAVIAREILEQTDLAGHFDAVAGPGLDESGAAKHLVVGQALAQHGGPDPDRVRMVGDRSFDVHGAAAHGVRTVGVLWGFGSAQELQDSGAHAVVDHPRSLASAIFSRGPAAAP